MELRLAGEDPVEQGQVAVIQVPRYFKRAEGMSVPTSGRAAGTKRIPLEERRTQIPTDRSDLPSTVTARSTSTRSSPRS